MRGEFPETLCIEQGVVLSCRFAKWKVRRAPRVLWTGSRESVKCQVRQEACVPSWNNQLYNTVEEQKGPRNYKLRYNVH